MPALRPMLLPTLLCVTALSFSLPAKIAHANSVTQISASTAAASYQAENTYSITRKGKKIGTHSLSFLTDGTALSVTAKSDIKVTVLKIPVFRFNYESTESWSSDQLVSVESTTTTDKQTEQSSLNNKGGKSEFSYNSKNTGSTQASTERIDFATNHWNINAVTQSILFNTIKGVASNVVVKDHGQKTITINGETLKTNHYEYTDDLQVQSWYDLNNRWVKLLFIGTDGSEITYTIDTP